MVDDYYASIPSSDGDAADISASKKPKIKAKKKIVIKKIVEKSDNIVNKEEATEVKTSLSEPLKSIKSKKIVQNMEVVKREPLKKKENISTEPPVAKKPLNSNPPLVSKNFKNKNAHSEKESEDVTERPKKSKLWGFGERKTRWRLRFIEDKDVTFVRSNKMSKKKKEEKKVEDIKQNLVDRKWETVVITDILTVKEFSEKIGITLPLLIAEFMKNGMMVNINSQIDFDTASIISDVFWIKLDRDDSKWANMEDVLAWNLELLLAEDDSSKLSPRAPVVSIMWHVDHGKTSLLDYIRKSNHAAWEAGWITQSIWAYQVELNEENHGREWKITFLDTPWHEAFTVMRARWAKSTDIAVLVVASDEWVKPQTIESINHAKEAGIPVIVAINKMDKEGANPDHIKWQLSEHGLTPEDWWGDTPMVPVSALSGFWINDLLEIILLVAEMKELKANPDRNGIATVIESHLDLKFWPVATVLVNTGTMHSGDDMVCSDSFWKIKILKNYKGESVQIAIPGEPVLVVGLSKVVEGWDIFQVVNSPDIAKEKAFQFKELMLREKWWSASSLDLLMSKIKAWNLKQLKIILKSDTNGSLEAIKTSLLKLSTEETMVSVIHSWVWSITEGDILMWQWSNAILVWFNVWVLSTARGVLDSSLVEYISSKIIYHITDKIEKIVTGMFDPKEVETIIGRAKVWGIFYTSKEFLVIGLILKEFLEDGANNKIQNRALVRVIRKDKMVWSWKIESLKTGTLEVKELEWPTECWIKFVWNANIEMWDELEIYTIQKHK